MNESDPKLQKLKNDDGDKAAATMMEQAASHLGFPPGTRFMEWPRKPLSPAKGASGKGIGSKPSRSGKASRGKSHSRSSKGKHKPFAGWD